MQIKRRKTMKKIFRRFANNANYYKENFAKVLARISAGETSTFKLVWNSQKSWLGKFFRCARIFSSHWHLSRLRNFWHRRKQIQIDHENSLLKETSLYSICLNAFRLRQRFVERWLRMLKWVKILIQKNTVLC